MRMLDKKQAGAVLLLFLGVGLGFPLSAQDCPSLMDERRREILSYASVVFKIGDPGSLRIIRESMFSDTCYRSLVIDGGSLKQPLTVVLSPDQRFLSGWVLDLNVRPEQARVEGIQHTKELLLSEKSPQRGNSNAPITIVEFGDFECPYCKQFNEWIAALPIGITPQINLIYKHLPLAKHAWANEAAAATTCASFQSNEAFWKLHDFVFVEQEKISLNTVRDRVRAFLATMTSFDMSQFDSCMQTRQFEKIVARDAALARVLSVVHTPTIFINGVRVEGLKTSEDLTRLLLSAGTTPILGESNPLPSKSAER